MSGYLVELCVGALSGTCEVKKLLVWVLLEEVCTWIDLDLSLEAAGWYPEKLFLLSTWVENSFLVLRQYWRLTERNKEREKELYERKSHLELHQLPTASAPPWLCPKGIHLN